MKSVLERFAPFRLSPLTANSYIFYVPITDFTDVTESKLKKVAEIFKLSTSEVVDELIAFRLTLAHDSKNSLEQHFRSGNLHTFDALCGFAETALLVCSSNTILESGFSAMKSTETVYETNMTTEIYDALRVIQDFWNSSELADVSVANELDYEVTRAALRYNQEIEEKALENTRKRAYAEDLRDEIHVFKRQSTLAAQNQPNANNKELQEARELVKRLEAKQAELVKATDVPLRF